MKWLILTDFHIGRVDDCGQHNALTSLLTTLTRVCHDPLDAVLFAGDITYSGKREQYMRFSDILLKPLRSTPILTNAKFLAVPGNHDLDHDRVDPLHWTSLGEDRKSKYFEASPVGTATRKRRAEAFAAFDEFVDREGLIAPVAAREVCRTHQLLRGSQAVTFLLINTSFLCNVEGHKDEGTIPFPLSSLRTNIQALTEPVFVVGHHPVHSFPLVDQRHLRSLLSDYRAVYLHGHTHMPDAKSEQGGLSSIGFGASYQASQESTPKPFYRNSFAICTLMAPALEVQLYEWDSENGRWAPGTNVPPGLTRPGEVPTGKYVLRTPFSPLKKASAPSPNALPPRRAPSATSVTPILGAQAADLLKRRDVANRLALPSGEPPREVIVTPSRAVAQYSTAAGEVRAWVFTASGQMLTRDDVEEVNTTLDYEGLAAVYIVTIGPVATEARSSYERLRERKPITLLGQDEVSGIFDSSIGRIAQQTLLQLDAAVHAIEYLFSPESLYVLVYEKSSVRWFYILDTNANIVPESHESVRTIRQARPRFAAAQYGPRPNETDPQPKAGPRPIFDPNEYRRLARMEFNQVRYAALAALGFRFSSITLEELYVSANASDGDASELAVTRAVDDALQNLQLPDELRSQLEAQVRSMLRGKRSNETLEARRLYQRHRNVIVLGDPGSGKTFFIKHEILAYCKEERESWYREHIPVYVPLRELSQFRSDTDSLLARISLLCARRGLVLPAEMLTELSSGGKVAFFFDGLDEISSLEERGRILADISELLSTASVAGSRVVVTSRPAATRLVEIPRDLRPIALKGLTINEMRTLANRVLASRMAENGITVSIAETDLPPSDQQLVDKIVSDCSEVPGLRRLAQNPLLFTLLIQIYANSGPPSAKRHRVYQQAAQTLATVRSQETGQRPFSESDLRRRLGAIALSLFQEPGPGVPRWADAVAILRSVIAVERGSTEVEVSDSEAEEFLQGVGEGTGLVIPRRIGESLDAEVFTFMHYSFMEYYAAVGLLLSDDAVKRAAELAHIPRWNEVLLLFAGILADQTDASALTQYLLESSNDSDRVTLERLDFAIDCALEADVPTERQITSMLGFLDRVGYPALKRDPELRRRIGRQVQRVYSISQSEHVESFLATRLADPDALVCAVTVEITAYALESSQTAPDSILSAFREVCERKISPPTVSICEAISVAPCLRIPEALSALTAAFQRSRPAVFAAARACERSGALARAAWDELLSLLRSNSPYLSLTAANAVLRAGWQIDYETPHKRADVRRALECLIRDGGEHHVTSAPSAVAFHDVEKLLTSSDMDLRVLGIHLLPWTQGAERRVYEWLMAVLSDQTSDRSAVVGALGALRLSPRARQLLRLSDMDNLYSMLRAPTRDVRMAAARLVGHTQVEARSRQELIDYAKRAVSNSDEFRAALRALGEAEGDLSDVHDYLESELRTRLRPKSRSVSDATRREILELLQLTIQSNELGSQPIIRALKNVVEDRRWSQDVRGASLVSLAWLWEPSEQSVSFLIKIVREESHGMHAARAEAVWRFALRCKRKVAYVRALSARLDELTSGVVYLASRTPLAQSAQQDYSKLRRALAEIASMKNAYQEYTARSSPYGAALGS